MKRLITMLLALLLVSSVVTFRIKAQHYIPVSPMQLKINSENFNVSRLDMKFLPRSSPPLLIKEIICTALKGFMEAVRNTTCLVSKERKVTIPLKGKFLNLYSNNPIAEVNGSKVKISENSSVKPIIVNLRRLISIEFLLESLKGRVLKEHLNIPINIILNKEVIVL